MGMTKEYLKEKGFFVLQFRYHYQIERFTKFIGEYVPLHMQSLITISPFSKLGHYLFPWAYHARLRSPPA